EEIVAVAEAAADHLRPDHQGQRAGAGRRRRARRCAGLGGAVEVGAGVAAGVAVGVAVGPGGAERGAGADLGAPGGVVVGAVGVGLVGAALGGGPLLLPALLLALLGAASLGAALRPPAGAAPGAALLALLGPLLPGALLLAALLALGDALTGRPGARVRPGERQEQGAGHRGDQQPGAGHRVSLAACMVSIQSYTQAISSALSGAWPSGMRAPHGGASRSLVYMRLPSGSPGATSGISAHVVVTPMVRSAM